MISPMEHPDYPSSDGKSIADCSQQFSWLTTIQGSLECLFAHDPNVMVAGDLLWYPVQGHPATRMAPDVMVIQGRPKQGRGAYIQHLEANIPPQVVFEIRSHLASDAEMAAKLQFYETHGVEEYYVLDPHCPYHHFGYQRLIRRLVALPDLLGWISPRLGIRFEMTDELRIFDPAGRRFLTYLEKIEERDAAREALEASLARLARLQAQLVALGLDPEDEAVVN